MKKSIFVISLLFLLSACNAGPEDQKLDMEKVQANLPEGCTLYYAGSVRVEGFSTSLPSRVFVTVCGNTVTTSQTNLTKHGKSGVDNHSVSVVTGL
jgi:hypothetical protein